MADIFGIIYNNIIPMMMFRFFVHVLVIFVPVTSLELGAITEQTYQKAMAIIARDKTGLKMCGRNCLYQDKCSAVNFNPEALVCELLETGGTSESVTEFLFSPINTWTMDKDSCHPNPCTEKQKCLKSASNGYFCQTITTPCDHIDCQHGGTCTNRISSFECFCTFGTSGTFCETTPCTPAPCINGGTCSFSGDQYSCACASGYFGTNCELNVCTPNPCLNSGTCAITGGGHFQCTCPTQWSGTTCTESICDTAPCMYTGTCTPLSATTYSCACASGFSGTQCQVTPCSTGPCQYGGKCSIAGTNYQCSCASGFSGTNCQITPCSSGPCYYGTCHISGSTYTCACPSGYSGTNCQLQTFTTVSLTYSGYTNNADRLFGPYNVGTGYKASLRFTRMDTESNYDYLKIYDGSNVNAPLLATKTGTSLGGDIVTSGQYVTLHWTTDGSVIKTGFDIIIFRFI